jgi:hypothetical protein
MNRNEPVGVNFNRILHAPIQLRRINQSSSIKINQSKSINQNPIKEKETNGFLRVRLDERE